MIWFNDAMKFFIKMMNKNYCVAKATEQFFEEVLMKKNEHNGLNYSFTWYKVKKYHGN